MTFSGSAYQSMDEEANWYSRLDSGFVARINEAHELIKCFCKLYHVQLTRIGLNRQSYEPLFEFSNDKGIYTAEGLEAHLEEVARQQARE